MALLTCAVVSAHIRNKFAGTPHLQREVPSTMGPEAAYLVMSSAAHVMHGAHALHQALQDGAHPVAPRFLALVRETIHRLTELMEMAQEFTVR